MKKKILIGSMLILTLLLLMPSIPAVQKATIEDGIKQDIQDKLDVSNLDYFKDIFDEIKHPILYSIVIWTIMLRFKQMDANTLFAINMMEKGFLYIFALIFTRSIWIAITLRYYTTFWNNISETFGWNWDIDIY